ncbi:MAG: proline dehydrogenase family protein [Candidatus Eisenbacteria bacterium]
MSVLRSMLLAGSENPWLRQQATRRRFVRRAVSRFMPGESFDEAVAAARTLAQQGIGTIVTNLGENVSNRDEATAEVEHYAEVLRRLEGSGLDAEISVKLTHLGLDLDPGLADDNLARLAALAAPSRTRLWIDMEGSAYTDRTLEAYRRVRRHHLNVGIALQAYLRRTAADLASLLPGGPIVRLVKGAYREPAEIAFARMSEVNENFFSLSVALLDEEARRAGAWVALGTHDTQLIDRVATHADRSSVPRDAYEYAMLYGIRRDEQARLRKQGHRVRVLISYGSQWFPWYMRRLAERPANLWFVAKSAFAG